MKKLIGGLIPVATSNPNQARPCSDLTRAVIDSKPELGGFVDFAFMMSGRCAISHCLQDALQSLGSTPSVRAYVPAYTCETVIAPFTQLNIARNYYKINQDLTPEFVLQDALDCDLILFSPYYGFKTYEQAEVRESSTSSGPVLNFHQFLSLLEQNKKIIIFDLTHSLFDPDPLPQIYNYAAGSFRKWLGVPAGGIAIKKDSRFGLRPLPPNPEHLQMRNSLYSNLSLFIKDQANLPIADQVQALEQINQEFWAGEMKLRQIFNNYGSDPVSEQILENFDYRSAAAIRRDNYHYLLDNLPAQLTDRQGKLIWKIIFPKLGATCPSHFSLLSDCRDELMGRLSQDRIKATVYWPPIPSLPDQASLGAKQITDHILSLPCDQRFGRQDMARIVASLSSF